METKRNKLDELKGQNPFKLPEGYLEGLNEQIMNRLPDKIPEAAPKVSLYDRIRPLLYMAGVFAGLLLLFRVFTLPDLPRKASFANEALPVQQATVAEETWYAASITDEDQEFMDYLAYLEDEYYNSTYVEKMENE
jgi:hypothetical protein